MDGRECQCLVRACVVPPVPRHLSFTHAHTLTAQVHTHSLHIPGDRDRGYKDTKSDTHTHSVTDRSWKYTHAHARTRQVLGVVSVEARCGARVQPHTRVQHCVPVVPAAGARRQVRVCVCVCGPFFALWSNPLSYAQRSHCTSVRNACTAHHLFIVLIRISFHDPCPTHACSIVCEPNVQYMTKAMTTTTHRECANLTVCDAASQYETVPHTTTSDRKCAVTATCVLCMWIRIAWLCMRGGGVVVSTPVINRLPVCIPATRE